MYLNEAEFGLVRIGDDGATAIDLDQVIRNSKYAK
jgi:hypothetical protein